MAHVNRSKNNNKRGISSFGKIQKRVSSLFSPKTNTKQSKLALANDSIDWEQKTNRKVKFDEDALIGSTFISQLKAIKAKDEDVDCLNIPDECFTKEHFEACLKEMKLEFDDEEIQDILNELMDADFGFAFR